MMYLVRLYLARFCGILLFLSALGMLLILVHSVHAPTELASIYIAEQGARLTPSLYQMYLCLGLAMLVGIAGILYKENHGYRRPSRE